MASRPSTICLSAAFALLPACGSSSGSSGAGGTGGRSHPSGGTSGTGGAGSGGSGTDNRASGGSTGAGGSAGGSASGGTTGADGRASGGTTGADGSSCTPLTTDTSSPQTLNVTLKNVGSAAVSLGGLVSYFALDEQGLPVYFSSITMGAAGTLAVGQSVTVADTNVGFDGASTRIRFLPKFNRVLQ